ncbi:hypothetical protein M378DRAFT_167227 [Amanita muscaria Koide BX008]|uniref:Uncharacterized protein n=1 Tax=Amanita muscaria (strain Koide BX008) TaxID=946122 RepID=A0A0C2SDV0_AMAMK|nr:hypothetical protein M378DRAFT_167227 [Amanita muscaria Koide BX008]
MCCNEYCLAKAAPCPLSSKEMHNRSTIPSPNEMFHFHFITVNACQTVGMKGL